MTRDARDDLCIASTSNDLFDRAKILENRQSTRFCTEEIWRSACCFGVSSYGMLRRRELFVLRGPQTLCLEQNAKAIIRAQRQPR